MYKIFLSEGFFWVRGSIHNALHAQVQFYELTLWEFGSHTQLKTERQRQYVVLQLSGCTDVRHYSLQVSSHTVWFAFASMQSVCFWLRRCFLLSLMLFSKTLLGYRRTPHTSSRCYPAMRLSLISLCVISSTLLLVVAVLHRLQGYSGWSAPSKLSSRFVFSCFFPYCLSKTRGSLVCGLSIPVQTVKQTDTGWGESAGAPLGESWSRNVRNKHRD